MSSYILSSQSDSSMPSDPRVLNEDKDVLERKIDAAGKDVAPVLELEGLERHSDNDDGLLAFPPHSNRVAKNWSMPKKVAHTIAYGSTTLAAQVCASVISPAVTQISRELNVGEEVAMLAFSIYIIGNAVGPPIFGPLSELYGRKIGILIPTFLAGVCLCICANVTSIAALVVFRFLGGILGAAPIVGAVGAMSDMWAPTVLTAAIALYAANLVLGSVSAPVFGSLLLTTGHYGWRWSCWLAGLLSITVSVVNYIFLSESYLPVVEQAHAKKARLSSKNWSLHAAHDQWSMSLKEFASVHLLRPIIMFVTPIVLLMNVFASFMYGLFFLIITSVGYEYERVHHFTSVTSYLPLYGFFIGFLFGGAINIVASIRYVRIVKSGVHPLPEERLVAMMMFGWLMPCGMLLYGWTMKDWIHWVVPTVGLGFVGAGFLVIFQGCLMYLIDNYIKYVASAIASNTILRSVFGGVFPLFAIQMYDGMNVHWASSLLAFVCVLLLASPYLFWGFGAKIRRSDPLKKLLER